ncbi:MAG: LCP family protein [Sarcina sp.]
MKIILVSIFLVIIGVIAAGGAYVVDMINDINKVAIDKENLGVDKDIDGKNKDIRNIALFGIDSLGSQGRSDAIMILTLDKKNSKVKLTSIMRDSYVNVNGKMDKINHAYAYGGPELAIRTLNENFGLNIKDFVSVNFDSLKTTIDTVGGVQMKITEEEASGNNIPGINKSGVYTLTGEQTLAYSRIRYASGDDYQRTQRQRNVMDALYERLRYVNITDYPKIIKGIMPNITTNLSVGEILDLSTQYSGIISAGLDQHRFPRDGEGKGINIENTYYLQYDLEVAKEAMRAYIFDDKRISFGEEN